MPKMQWPNKYSMLFSLYSTDASSGCGVENPPAQRCIEFSSIGYAIFLFSMCRLLRAEPAGCALNAVHEPATTKINAEHISDTSELYVYWHGCRLASTYAYIPAKSHFSRYQLLMLCQWLDEQRPDPCVVLAPPSANVQPSFCRPHSPYHTSRSSKPTNICSSSQYSRLSSLPRLQHVISRIHMAVFHPPSSTRRPLLGTTLT